MPEFDEKKASVHEKPLSPDELAIEERRAEVLKQNYGQTRELGIGNTTENLKHVIGGEKRLSPDKVEPDFQVNGGMIHPDLSGDMMVNIYMKERPQVGYTIGFETQSVPDQVPWAKELNGKVITGMGYSAALDWLREKAEELSGGYKKKREDSARADQLREELKK